MKFCLALALAPALMVTPALAESNCPLIGKLAFVIMQSRQAGMEMSVEMTIVDKSSPSIRPMIKALIISAWDQPQMMVEENRTQVEESFRNDTEVACYKAGQ